MSPAEAGSGRLTVTECCVLGLLVQKDQSGYDLNRSAQENVGLIYAPAKSRIYAVLPGLLKRGLVTRRELAQRKRQKFVYRITPAGRRALRDWLNDTGEPLGRPVLLLKVFFGADADPDALSEQLLRRRAEIAAEFELLREIDRMREEWHSDVRALFQGLTLDWGLAIDPIELAWIDRALERIAASKRDDASARAVAGRGG